MAPELIVIPALDGARLIQVTPRGHEVLGLFATDREAWEARLAALRLAASINTKLEV